MNLVKTCVFLCWYITKLLFYLCIHSQTSKYQCPTDLSFHNGRGIRGQISLSGLLSSQFGVLNGERWLKEKVGKCSKVKTFRRKPIQLFSQLLTIKPRYCIFCSQWTLMRVSGNNRFTSQEVVGSSRVKLSIFNIVNETYFKPYYVLKNRVQKYFKTSL